MTPEDIAQEIHYAAGLLVGKRDQCSSETWGPYVDLTVGQQNFRITVEEI